MEFLRRHFEKLILGLMLVGIIASSYYLMHCIQGAKEEVQKVQVEANNAIQPGKGLPVLTDKGFDALTVLTDPALAILLVGTEAMNGLLAPSNYIRCLNPECMHLLSFKTKICPYCKTEQPLEQEEDDIISLEDDADSDGIPNVVENKYEFLNSQNESDAIRDQDRDTFTNVEEYRAKTALDDPKSFPPLAKNLRYLKIAHRPIPVLLKKISRNSSDDPKRWDATCSVLTKGKWKTTILRLGNTVADYEIIEMQEKTEERVNPRTKRKEQVDASEVRLKKKDAEESYVLSSGKTTYEKDLIVQFFYLSNRYSPKRCRRFYAKLGQKIQLTHRSGTKENYTVTVLSKEKKIESVAVSSADTKADPVEFKIKKISRRRDFIRSDRTATRGQTRRRPVRQATGRYPARR